MIRYRGEVAKLVTGPGKPPRAYKGQIWAYDPTKGTVKLIDESFELKLYKEAKTWIKEQLKQWRSKPDKPIAVDTASTYLPKQEGFRVALLNPAGFKRPTIQPRGHSMAGKHHTPEAREAIGAAVRKRHEEGAYKHVKLGRKTNVEREQRRLEREEAERVVKAARRHGVTHIERPPLGLVFKPLRTRRDK